MLNAVKGDRRTVFPARWHSFFTAQVGRALFCIVFGSSFVMPWRSSTCVTCYQVPAYVAEYHQVDHDNDLVYLLQMISTANRDRYRLPSK